MNPCPCWLFCSSHTCWKKCPVFRIRLKQSLQQDNCQATFEKPRMSSYDINPNSELWANDSKLPAISASSLIPLNYNTVDGRESAPVEVGRLFHYLQGFIDPRWFSRRIFFRQQLFANFLHFLLEWRIFRGVCCYIVSRRVYNILTWNHPLPPKGTTCRTCAKDQFCGSQSLRKKVAQATSATCDMGPVNVLGIQLYEWLVNGL